MRRPPFQVNPLALSVALLLAAPAAAVAQDTPTPYSPITSVTIPKADTLTVTAGAGQGVVTATNATPITVDGVVQGIGQLIKQGDGTLSLTNNNTYQGGTDIQQGTLSVKSASALSNGAVNIADGATLATQASTTISNALNINQANASNATATISTSGANNVTQITSKIVGVGSLVKAGEGTLSLSADNAYTGTANVQEGSLNMTGVVQTGQIVKQGAGTLSLTNNNNDYTGGINVQQGALSITGVVSGGPIVKQGAGTLSLTNNNNDYTGGINVQQGALSITGVVSGGPIVKQGAGTLSLTNNNTYAGGTDIQQGTLSIKRASSLGDGDVIIREGSTLETQTSTTITNKINLTPETPVDDLLTTAATISTVGKENITQITSSIGGSVSGLIKSGDGTLSLTADNAYAGNTVIQQGTLAISREGSLGVGTTVTINNGTVLQTNKDVIISKGVILDSQSTIDTDGNNSKVTGNISGAGQLVKFGDGSLTLDTKVTALDGTVSYKGNDYDGGTLISGGLLIVNDNKDLGKANTNVAITGGTLQIANDITLERNIVTSTTAGGSISTAGHNVVLEGAVFNGGNGGHLVKSGAGKLTLTSALSDYNFGTTK